jgi:hypothetical protein
MTSTELPDFVKSIFQNELNKIKINLIKHISKDYSLDENELIKKYTCDLEIINKNLENVQITKKNNYNYGITSNNRCCARVYNNGKGARCKRSKNKTELCTLHNNLLEKNGKLKYGLINEPQPKDVFLYIDPKREKIY